MYARGDAIKIKYLCASGIRSDPNREPIPKPSPAPAELCSMPAVDSAQLSVRWRRADFRQPWLSLSLFEIESPRTVTILAARHQRADDY